MFHRAAPYSNPRGAADILNPSRKSRGVGAGGDFCATNCPVDGEGRIHHACGYQGPANVQVFTDIVTLSTFGPTTGTLTYTVSSKEFCPEFFLIPDTPAPFVIIDNIRSSSGDSLLLGTNSVLAEFFSSKDDRGNRISGCCQKAGLKYFVDIRLRDIAGVEIITLNVQGSFWGAIK